MWVGGWTWNPKALLWLRAGSVLWALGGWNITQL